MSARTSIPRLPARDSTLAFLREGYPFISRRCDAVGSDAFATRLLGSEVVCVRGRDAARMFCTPGRFTRRSGAPPTTTRLLQGKGSVHQLDGEAHRRRKAMFLQLLDAGGTARLVEEFDRQWQARTARWQQLPEVILQTEAERALCAAVHRWAGMPVPASEQVLAERARELGAMIDGAGAWGPRWVRGWRLRRRHERRVRRAIIDLRRRGGPDASPALVIARFRDPSGALLPMQAAVNEMVNLLRPTVAVGRWITFAALALHRHPELRPRFVEPGFLLQFVQEVRRYYPFFPVAGARVRQPFEWSGHYFSEGDWVMLDLYGTNHHPVLWKDPHRFSPDRFAGWTGDAFSLIPQGGGEFLDEHRCPGENPSIALVMAAVGRLLRLDYRVPRQDLRYPLNRFPTGPRSGFIIAAARAKPAIA